MPTRANLAALARALRNAHTRLLPIEMAERIQHLIVRIEELFASPVVDMADVEALSRQAKQLLDECDALSAKL
jgi:ribosome maturation factor RimP